jgi:hypothetical protein
VTASNPGADAFAGRDTDSPAFASQNAVAFAFSTSANLFAYEKRCRPAFAVSAGEIAALPGYGSAGSEELVKGDEIVGEAGGLAPAIRSAVGMEPGHGDIEAFVVPLGRESKEEH